MQFCPKCGSRNQDDRAACWKCFGQLQAGSKKAQRIQLTDRDEPAAGVHATPEPAAEESLAAAVVPIPELAEPEPAVTTPDFALSAPAESEAAPAFSVDEPVTVEEPAPQAASLGDVMIPSPSFGSADETDEDEEDVPAKPVPILGLVNLPEDEQDEPAVLDLDEPETEPSFGLGGLSDEPLVAGTAEDVQSADGTEPPLPWWLAQDENEDASAAAAGSNVLDLDGDLKIISLDDEDPDTKKSSPDA